MGQADWMERLLSEMDAFIRDSAFVHVQDASEAKRIEMTAKHTGKVVILADMMRQRAR